ncbi:MAG: hypothetical protein QF860_12600 [Planctomycetota bacterium]|nr:hypothetical protein [Planctomycetota bacterium]
MIDPAGPSPRPEPWTLAIGPGARLDRLGPWLAAGRPDAATGGPDAIDALTDWDDLISTFPETGRLVVDADTLSDWDGGRIEAFLAAHPTWHLHLCGRDSTRSATRRLLARDRSGWTPWPPDLDALEDFLRDPAGTSASPASIAPRETTPEASGAQSFGGEAPPRATDPAPPAEAAPGSSAPPEATPRLDPKVRAEIETILERPAVTTPSPTPPRAEPAAPAAYFRRQVADLADIAQRLRFSLARCRATGEEEGPPETAALADLEAELLRLQQFTRTLGFTASPPPRGDQTLDLRRLLEEQLASLTADGPRPTTHLAAGEALPIAGDKALLAQALDAVLFLALSTTGAEGILRIEAAADGSRARVSLAFPAGPLAGLDPAAILEPYGVASLLPELGPNALAAARGIARGQDGSLSLSAGPEDHLIWILELPLAE